MLFAAKRNSVPSPANDGRLLRKDIFDPKSEKRNVTGMRGFRHAFFRSFFAFFFAQFFCIFHHDFHHDFGQKTKENGPRNPCQHYEKGKNVIFWPRFLHSFGHSFGHSFFPLLGFLKIARYTSKFSDRDGVADISNWASACST